LIPSIIIIAITIPSFALLYAIDEVIIPAIIIKAIGHQWYWSYEYANFAFYFIKNTPDYNSVPRFDSYMISENDLKLGQRRLLKTDWNVILPILTHVKIIITGADVLHSWAVPSLGIKVDAVPGRLSQTNLFIKREGIYYGQCSEICGVNHGFMPITVRGLKTNYFLGISYVANSL